jgi:hypothetical protein
VSDDIEEAASLENDAIDAMATLTQDHGYSEEDLERLVESALDR